MKIAGAKTILNITEPKLVFGYWQDSNSCTELLAKATKDEVTTILEKHIDLSIWVGKNGYQVYPLSQVDGTIECTDINIVGDASPTETLWFIFEKNEWQFLDQIFNIQLSTFLESIWDQCENLSKDSYSSNNGWALEYLNNDIGQSYNHIIEADVEIKLN